MLFDSRHVISRITDEVAVRAVHEDRPVKIHARILETEAKMGVSKFLQHKRDITCDSFVGQPKSHSSQVATYHVM